MPAKKDERRLPLFSLPVLRRRFNEWRQAKVRQATEAALAKRLACDLTRLDESLSACSPKIIVLKQDVNEDLYCCPQGTKAAEQVRSTLLRTGPVALFADAKADFQIVSTVDDLECQIWKQRATHLKWDSLEFFSSYRNQIPGRDYGQSRWAVHPEAVDWGQYDIVVSMDVCVPRRITRMFPNTLWAYYVREIKSPAFGDSLKKPARGQDVVLNHSFRLRPPKQMPHVLEFPYHLQRPGGYHRLFEVEQPADLDRGGVFVDHHTMLSLTGTEREALQEFGVVASTIHAGEREVIPSSEQLPRRTMEPDLCERLLNSQFFLITPGKRAVFGTALVEAIAAGCLAVGNPASFGSHGFLFTKQTTALNAQEAIRKMRHLVAHPRLYLHEVQRQRDLVEALCYARPMHDLLAAWQQKLSKIHV